MPRTFEAIETKYREHAYDSTRSFVYEVWKNVDFSEEESEFSRCVIVTEKLFDSICDQLGFTQRV